MSKTLKVIGNLSAIIGILVFLYPFLSLEEIKLTLVQKIFISISLLICIVYFFVELFSGPKKYRNDRQINDYMKKWIGKTGRTVIFTRDMSWVDNDEIKDELRKKANRKELIICQPSRNELTNYLEKEGAEINTYSDLNFTPKSRFTFINYDTNSSKVAIGKKDNSHDHIITEFNTTDTIEYYLAEDLVNLIKALN